MAFLGGFVDGPEAEATTVQPEYVSATERLEQYRCNLAAEKTIIMGGVEDNYAAEGDEQAVVNDALIPHSKLYNHSVGRNYDQGGQDFIFVDEFDLPKRTFKGILTISLKELSNIRNDEISIGIQSAEALEEVVSDYLFFEQISELENRGWQKADGYYWIDLSELRVKSIGNDLQYLDDPKTPHLLRAVQQSREDQFLLVYIQDDTMVDFIGFALCLKPEEKMGFVFSSTHYLYDKRSDFLVENQLNMSKAVVNGTICLSQTLHEL